MLSHRPHDANKQGSDAATGPHGCSVGRRKDGGPEPTIGPTIDKYGEHAMAETFDFVIVGGGSAGAVIAARLSEDPTCRVALIEAGERPPEIASMPVACGAMQMNPDVDWMYSADPGEKAGLGLNDRRVPVPRGKMLGGS
jgi:GMC oxidoreductase